MYRNTGRAYTSEATIVGSYWKIIENWIKTNLLYFLKCAYSFSKSANKEPRSIHATNYDQTKLSGFSYYDLITSIDKSSPIQHIWVILDSSMARSMGTVTTSRY